jgi:hypothetical protein
LQLNLLELVSPAPAEASEEQSRDAKRRCDAADEHEQVRTEGHVEVPEESKEE